MSSNEDDDLSTSEASDQDEASEGRFEMETIQMDESPSEDAGDGRDGIVTMEEPPEVSNSDE